MNIKTKEAAELLGINEKTFRVWVKKGLVPVRRIGTCHALFDPNKLLDWWKSVENVPDALEPNIGRKAKIVRSLSKKRHENDLALWRENRKGQVVNG